MGRIVGAFARLDGRAALIPFLMAGDPDLETSERLLRTAASVGDIVEIGIPFSDPIADGPTIQRAGQRALAGGTTLNDTLELVRRLRRNVSIPVVLLTYFNPIFQFGLEPFCREAVDAGVDGIVIPDLPADESDALLAPARIAGLDTIFLVAPTTSDRRITMAAERSRGFVYCVSLTGVTGARSDLPVELTDLVRRVKSRTSQPVCVGFGISTPEQAASVAKIADGVIVGSALVDLVDRAGPEAEAMVTDFLQTLRRAL